MKLARRIGANVSKVVAGIAGLILLRAPFTTGDGVILNFVSLYVAAFGILGWKLLEDDDPETPEKTDPD